jgi:starch phosphorylase
MEASGTGNMKLSLNGALTVGTWDGANIEIMEAVGEENFFAFGLKADEVIDLRRRGCDAGEYCRGNAELRRALEMVDSGYFSCEEPELFRPLVKYLTTGDDPYLILADFEAYLAAQDRVDRTYRDQKDWNRKAVLNVARMGRFSIDRTVKDYASRVWGIPVTDSGGAQPPDRRKDS